MHTLAQYEEENKIPLRISFNPIPCIIKKNLHKHCVKTEVATLILHTPYSERNPLPIRFVLIFHSSSSISVTG